MTFNKLYTISFDYEHNYEQNLKRLIKYIEQTEESSVVVVPELCLTHYSFEKLEEGASFSQNALKKLLPLSKNRVISLTIIEKENNKFLNTAITLFNNQIVHKQSKHKLFKFGDEHKYFSPGDIDKIKIFKIGNIRFAMLICFELRFIDLWQRIQGADIIMIPAMWGKLRKKQLEIITQSLAVISQAYIVVANSSSNDMAGSSAIITPFGKRALNDDENILSLNFSQQEVKKMRRYMDIGLS